MARITIKKFIEGGQEKEEILNSLNLSLNSAKLELETVKTKIAGKNKDLAKANKDLELTVKKIKESQDELDAVYSQIERRKKYLEQIEADIKETEKAQSKANRDFKSDIFNIAKIRKSNEDANQIFVEQISHKKKELQISLESLEGVLASEKKEHDELIDENKEFTEKLKGYDDIFKQKENEIKLTGEMIIANYESIKESANQFEVIKKAVADYKVIQKDKTDSILAIDDILKAKKKELEETKVELENAKVGILSCVEREQRLKVATDKIKKYYEKAGLSIDL